MARCANCKYVEHEQFKGHKGHWLCFHPYRKELDNKGDFTYPHNHNPITMICETEKRDYGKDDRHTQALVEAETPVWCYYEAVERAKADQPGFDPDRQREILWPESEKIGGCSNAGLDD